MKKSRTAIALVIAMILTLIAPTLSVDVEAYSQVYYNVDFSATLKKAAIKQQLSSDCGIISISNIESYMHGFTSTTDTMKVRDAVAKVNLGSTSGNPNYVGIESYANLGYVSVTYSLQNIYADISRGNPVLIHRYVSDNDQHFSVICGYVGSTTTLQESGFVVVNATHDGVTVERLDKWKKGTLKIYRRTSGIAYSGVSGIVLGTNYPELLHNKGDGMGVYGRIDSNANITQVSVSIVNAKTGANVYSKTVKPNSKTVKMYDNFDSAMKFGELANGDYLYYIYATNANNVVKTFSKYFKVSDTAITTAPSAPKYTVKYNANGGTGSIADKNIEFGSEVTVENANNIWRDGYKCVGWNLKRADGKWYVSGQGWKTDSEISSNNWKKAVYTIGEKYLANTSWISGANSLGNTFTFYAVWEKEPYMLVPYENFSGKNLISGTDFVSADDLVIESRDTTVNTVAIDTATKHNGYNSLKIVNAKAGASGKDLVIHTNTDDNKVNSHYNNQSKKMTLSFWAKCSVANNAIYFRWGYDSTSTYRKIDLTTSWKYYTVEMNKTELSGINIHPYVSAIGTVWISELQLENGSDATDFVPENGEKLTATESSFGGKYTLPAEPTREGYTFDGWFTEPDGGTQITGSTSVLAGHKAVYAHWSEKAISGWQSIDGKYYYCNDDGSYYTGWLNDGGHWYYLKETGEMVTGWTRVNGKWYYMNVSGIMRTGWLSDAGHWYYLTSNGDMTIGWKNIDGKYYYFDKNGYMYTGWLKDAGKWYYLTDDGEMATGWKLISGKYYFFTSNGDMYTGWKQDAGKWYFLSDDGDMAIGWKLISGTYYYFANTGEMLTGWVFDAGKWYYMDNSGAMVANKTMVIGGKAYWFDASGACMNP